MSPEWPLLRGFDAGDVVGWHRGETRRADWFCHAASGLSQRLPRARYMLNLCEGQLEFLLATAAALIARQTVILPSARLPFVIAQLRQRYAESYCAVDERSASDVTGEVVVAIEPAAGRCWPPPSIPPSHCAAILFTSGSTGEPNAHRKTWQELVGGTDTFMQSIARPPRGSAIVGSIAPQHMFGFETTVMLPLQSGTPVLASRPSFPGDLHDALDAAAALGVDAVWLMTTPLQLRAFHRELRIIHPLRRIVASTMPLDRDLAQAVERDWRVPLHEIYGCTEGGMLATRRPALDAAFTPGAGLAFAVDEHGATSVSGGHLAQRIGLQDRLRFFDHAFEIVGRDSDVVKIAGKRASLDALTRQVLQVPGVRDAAVFLPHSGAARVAAIVVAPELSPADLRRELAKRIDPAFMPRPLVVRDALPRNSNGKLTQIALREAIATPERGGARPAGASVLTQRCVVAADHPALPGHFPGRPIVPGVVLLNMVETMLKQSGYRVRECAEVKFRSVVAPSLQIDLRVAIADDHIARFIASTERGPAMTGTFICDRAAAAS